MGHRRKEEEGAPNKDSVGALKSVVFTWLISGLEKKITEKFCNRGFLHSFRE
jgi:hypothetical protein